jgi:hypothetical protein
MSPSKKNDLERDFAAAIYLSVAPSPPRFLSWGASSNCVVSESDQIHSLQLPEYMLSNTTDIPLPLLHTAYIHTVYLYVFTQGRRGVLKKGRGATQGRVQITKLGREYQHDLKVLSNGKGGGL